MRWLAVSLIAVWSCGWLSAQDPPSPEGVANWVEQLSSPQRNRRLDAEEQLIQLGPEILDWLPPLDTIAEATTRASLRRIRVALEREAAVHSLAPSRVHWPKGITLEEALKRLREQSGNPIAWEIDAALLRQPVEGENRELTFWEAVSLFESQFLLVLKESETERQLVLSRDEPAEPSAYPSRPAEAFLWKLESVTSKPIVNQDDLELFRIVLSVRSEPRLRPLFLKFKHSEIVVMDENGDPLKPFTPEAVVELPWGQSIAPVRLRLDFLVPKDKPPAELTLLMDLEVDVATGTADVEFRDWALPRESVRKAGVIVTRERLDDAPGRLRIPLRLAYESGGPVFESHRNWVYHNELVLHDGPRTLTPDAPLELTLEANGVLGLAYTFRRGPADWSRATLVYRVPTLLIKTRIPLSTGRQPILLESKKAEP
jgi:hypothetical protein